MGVNTWWSKISGERSSSTVAHTSPTFFQHQKVYKYISSIAKNKSVIDVGSGSGEGDYLLSQVAKKVVGVDKDKAATKEAATKFGNKKLNFINSEFSDLSLIDQFDIVISLQVIEHMDDVNSFLRILQRFSKNSGKVIISTPNRLTQGYNENPYHITEYTKAELEKLLKKYFKSVKILGLFGDAKVTQYENIRKRKILKLFSYDVFNARKFIPRSIKSAFFSALAFFIRKDIINNGILSQSYKISNYKNTCIDLVAICQK